MIYECYNLAEVKYMSKIDIISGFLGAGKTTLIKKLIAEAYQNEKIVLIENEFGEYTELHAIVTDAWEAGVEIQNELLEYVTNKQEQIGIISRTIEKIHKY